jgi:hypothetical protein
MGNICCSIRRYPEVDLVAASLGEGILKRVSAMISSQRLQLPIASKCSFRTSIQGLFVHVWDNVITE